MKFRSKKNSMNYGTKNSSETQNVSYFKMIVEPSFIGTTRNIAYHKSFNHNNN